MGQGGVRSYNQCALFLLRSTWTAFGGLYSLLISNFLLYVINKFRSPKTMATFRVFRYDPAIDEEPRYARYTVPVKPGMTVLEGLYYIVENDDPSLSFRSSCRAAVCGSCAMKINGEYRLACRTLIENLSGTEIRIEPLAHLPVMKDLVVDMERFYKKYESIAPFLIPKTFPEGKEFCQTVEERKQLTGLVECILCGACYAACTMVCWEPEFPGPFAFTWADARLRDTRDAEGRNRLLGLIAETGIWRCHTELNCTEVCPKGLSPTEAIQDLKRQAVLHRLQAHRSNEHQAKLQAEDAAESEQRIDRGRRRILEALVAGGGALIAAAMLGVAGEILLGTAAHNEEENWIALADSSKTDGNGEPKEIIYPVRRWEQGRYREVQKRAYLVQTQTDGLIVLDPTCTHLGCSCRWDAAIRNFLCPCHGGGFDREGKVTMGPPPRPLRRISHKVEGGILYVKG